jgi:hypothetical protein
MEYQITWFNAHTGLYARFVRCGRRQCVKQNAPVFFGVMLRTVDVDVNINRDTGCCLNKIKQSFSVGFCGRLLLYSRAADNEKTDGFEYCDFAFLRNARRMQSNTVLLRDAVVRTICGTKKEMEMITFPSLIFRTCITLLSR